MECVDNILISEFLWNK